MVGDQLVWSGAERFYTCRFLWSRYVNSAFGSPFLFDIKNSEYFFDQRGVAMSAQTHIMVAQSALQKHTKNLTACVDALDTVKQRIEFLLRDYEDDAPAYFTLLSIQKEVERVNGQIYGEVSL